MDMLINFSYGLAAVSAPTVTKSQRPYLRNEKMIEDYENVDAKCNSVWGMTRVGRKAFGRAGDAGDTDICACLCESKTKAGTVDLNLFLSTICQHIMVLCYRA